MTVKWKHLHFVILKTTSPASTCSECQQACDSKRTRLVLWTNHFRADGINLMVNKRGSCQSMSSVSIVSNNRPLGSQAYPHSFAHRERNEKIACLWARGSPGGTQKNLMGETPPRVLIPQPLYTIFDRKGILFVYLLLINCTPFTNLVWNFLFLLTAVNVLPLKYEQIKKKELYRRNSLG